MVARVAMDQPINPHQNAGPAGQVSEVVDPVSVVVCLLDAQAPIVAYELRAVVDV